MKNKQLKMNLQTEEIKSNELIEYKQIENTPLVARKFNDKWIITCGKYRSNTVYNSFEEAELNAINPNWDLIGLFILASNDMLNNQKN